MHVLQSSQVVDCELGIPTQTAVCLPTGMDQASADMSALSMAEAQPQQSSPSHATAPDRPAPAPPSLEPAAATGADEEDEDMDDEEESRQEALQQIQKQLDKADNRCSAGLHFPGNLRPSSIDVRPSLADSFFFERTSIHLEVSSSCQDPSTTAAESGATLHWLAEALIEASVDCLELSLQVEKQLGPL